jgi:peptidoglycan/xylan/chitin deacetylase (PgdA/CDA1 family)
MYHSISDDQEKELHPYYRINTSPEIFKDHMNYLRENNYKVINLRNIKEYYYLENVSSAKPIVITFDDGYRDFYTSAFPLLQKLNFTASIFLPTSFIGHSDSKLRGKEHLTWNEVRELSRAGMSFGSHTVTHPQLATMAKEEVEDEIKLSKVIIEDKLGQSIDIFSFPHKFPEADKTFKKLLSDLLKKYGYKYGVSTRIGMTSKEDDIYFMKRIPINSGDDISFFQAKLNRGYDWLNAPQHFYKIIKRSYI